MTTTRTGASIFAHLGRSAKPAAATEEEDDKNKGAKKAGAEDGEGDDDKEKDDKAKGKSAKAENDGDDDKEKDGEPKGKKAKKADAEDDDEGDRADEDDENDPDAKAARGRERRRIRAILVSEPGKANPAAAAHLATGTSMPRNQAIEMLAAMQVGMAPAAAAPAASAASRDTLRSRMAEVPNASVGTEEGRPEPNLADRIVAAGKKRRGEA